MMYNEICQYSSPNDSSSATPYGTVPLTRSFPYSLLNRKTNDLITFEELNNVDLLDQCREQCLNESQKAFDLLRTNFFEELNNVDLLDQCREQCLNESQKAFDLLRTNFDPNSSATKVLQSILQQIQDGLRSKTVI